jgi:eukaryotic-like serine/threonine-protein kinase
MMTWLLLLLLYAATQEARTVVVPKVIGLTVPRAEATLADAGLRLGKVTEVPSDYPRGIVMGQGPYPGKRVRINFECELWVSKGPGSASV